MKSFWDYQPNTTQHLHKNEPFDTELTGNERHVGLKIRRLLEAAPSLTLIMCTEPHMTDRGLKHNSNHVKSVRSVGRTQSAGWSGWKQQQYIDLSICQQKCTNYTKQWTFYGWCSLWWHIKYVWVFNCLLLKYLIKSTCENFGQNFFTLLWTNWGFNSWKHCWHTNVVLQPYKVQHTVCNVKTLLTLKYR